MVLTLPVVLLACAWWQRGRIGRQNLLRVLPFLLIGAVMTCVEVWAQHFIGAGDTMVRSDSLLSRAAVAGCAVWFYLWKLIWPVELILVYPRWSIDPRDVLSYLPGVLLVAILALGWWQRRRWGRPVVMLLVCYVGLLLPALGFVNIAYMQYSLVADHYQYAAMIVPCAIFAAVTATLGRPLWHRPTGYALCLGWLAVLGGLTWQQSRRYADAETLYRTTIAENPTCPLPYNNLGTTLTDCGRLDEAIVNYRKALEIKPDYAAAYNNLGTALAGRGQFDEAITQYEKSLEIRPDYTDARNNLGLSLAMRGRVDEAITQYQKTLELNPDFAAAYNNLGNALAKCGRLDEAITQYEKALEIKPDNAEADNNLGNLLLGRGKVDEAVALFRKALEINPHYVKAHNSLGNALAGRGQIDEAIAEYRKALEIEPGYVEAHNNLGNVMAGRGRFDEAIAEYQKAVEIRPQVADLHYNLGIALAGCGRFDEAIVHYQKALEIQPGHTSARRNLGIVQSQREGILKALAGRRDLLRLRPDDVALLNDTAWVLATDPNASIRNGAEAVELAGGAVRLSDGQEPAVLGTLAAAYAEAERFPEAAQTAHKALELATQQNKLPLAESIKAKIPLYESQTPYHEMPQAAAFNSAPP